MAPPRRRGPGDRRGGTPARAGAAGRVPQGGGPPVQQRPVRPGGQVPQRRPDVPRPALGERADRARRLPERDGQGPGRPATDPGRRPRPPAAAPAPAPAADAGAGPGAGPGPPRPPATGPAAGRGPARGRPRPGRGRRRPPTVRPARRAGPARRRPDADAKQQARWLLATAREQIRSGNYDDAAAKVAQARALNVRWGLFDDTPAKVGRRSAKARPKAVAARHGRRPARPGTARRPRSQAQGGPRG